MDGAENAVMQAKERDLEQGVNTPAVSILSTV